jgi:hypothetical protein
MKRISHLMLALLLILTAAPTHRVSLPLPPIPPAQPPSDGPAPIPDRDAMAPSAPPSESPRIVPRLVRVPTYQNDFDRSEGYIGGSRLQQDPADRRLTPSPGFNFQIPFK